MTSKIAALILFITSGYVAYSQTCETGSAFTATKANVVPTCTNVASMVPAFSGSAPGLVPSSLGGTTEYLRSDGTWQSISTGITYPLVNPTFTGTLSGPLVSATGGIQVTGNSSLPSATNSGLWMASGLPNPVVGRIYIGDGTGLSLSFAKRTGGVDTEVIHFLDDGSAVFDAGVTSEGGFAGTGLTVTGGSGVAGSLHYVTGSTNVTLTSATSLDFITNGNIRQINLDAAGNFNYGTNLQKLIDANRNIFPTAITASGTVTAPTLIGAAFTVNAAAGVWKPISFNSGALQRWQIGSDNSAESGSNSGSDFRIYAYADNGSTLSNPLIITRSTGQATFSARPNWGFTPWDSGNFTPANYLLLTGGTISGNLTVTGSLNGNFSISSSGVITGASLNTTGTPTSSLEGISDAGNLSVLGTTTVVAVTASGTVTAPSFVGHLTGSATSVPWSGLTGTVPTFNQSTTGTASNLSGTPALPNGITATTQTSADNTTKLATDAFVQAVVAANAPPVLVEGQVTIAAGQSEGNDSSHSNLSISSICTASAMNVISGTPNTNPWEFVINLSPSNISIVAQNVMAQKQVYSYICKP